jgi:two-component system, chemotaxis family, response regulator Rcp1
MVEPSNVKATRQVEILVVESNPAETLLTVEAFKAAGLTSGLRCISSGEALKYIGRKGPYAGVSLPDLVFLDLSQPSLTGLKVLKAIKADRELMHIPIVVAAGSDDPKFIRAVYKLNGNCFFQKPNEMAQFLRFIEMCYQFWGTVVTLSPPHDEPIRGQGKAAGVPKVKVAESGTG